MLLHYPHPEVNKLHTSTQQDQTGTLPKSKVTEIGAAGHDQPNMLSRNHGATYIHI